MKIFGVFGQFDYEGSALIGVFSSHEKAIEVMIAENGRYDTVSIRELTLDEYSFEEEQ